MQAKLDKMIENAVDIEKGTGITFYFLVYFICNAQETYCTFMASRVHVLPLGWSLETQSIAL